MQAIQIQRQGVVCAILSIDHFKQLMTMRIIALLLLLNVISATLKGSASF